MDRRRAARRAGRFTGLLFLWGLRTLILVALPFFLLIRCSLYLHLAQGWPVWLALACGVALMTALLAGYAGWLSQRLTGSHRLPRIALGTLALLVAGWAGFAVAYLSATNAKSEEVRAFYGSVHPILRLAIGTVILADGDLVVTDTVRQQGDYAAMGLAPRRRSLHFEQSDGYVHAVDLRTARRAEWRNGLLRAYFAVMGFPTLRHVGTWDHLHVSLRSEETAARPRARLTALP
jgi:hypothetical protein